MDNFIRKHLEEITVDKLVEFRADTFSAMASCSGGFNLGVNGLGQFVVKTRTETFKFSNPADAIEKYSELLSK